MNKRRIRYSRFQRSETEANIVSERTHDVFDAVFCDARSAHGIYCLELDKLFRYVRAGDTVVVQDMAMLAPSTPALCSVVRILIQKQVDVEFVREGLICRHDTPEFVKLVLSVVEWVAEFEQVLARERQRTGIASAKLRGAYSGRKKILSDDQVVELQARVEIGESKSKLARDFGVSRQTLYHYLGSARKQES